MPLRIGVDLDGVLADMEGALVERAQQLFGSRVTSHEDSDPDAPQSLADLAPGAATDRAPLQHELHLTEHERRVLWRTVCATENFWESLRETEPGIVAELGQMAATRRWEIIFLTRRPATQGDTAQRQSQRWLDAHGFPMPSVFVVTGSRGLIASSLGLDVVVDDTPENCVDVAADSKARTIAIFRDPELVPPPVIGRMGIHVVRSMQECLDVLAQFDAAVAPQPVHRSGLNRLMRTLGIIDPASRGA